MDPVDLAGSERDKMTTTNDVKENLTPTANRHFDPAPYLTEIKGKPYLEVKYRILWFKTEHPDGEIFTTLESTDPAIVRALIAIDGQTIATGHGMAISKGREVWSGREIEKAETAAIGRALAHAGFGTQFTGESEIDDGHLADTPGNAPTKSKPATRTAAVRPLSPDDLRANLKKKSEMSNDKSDASIQFRGFVAGHLASLFGSDDDRYDVTEYLTGQRSIKDVPAPMVYALRDWLGLDDGGEPNADARKEAQLVLQHVRTKSE